MLAVEQLDFLGDDVDASNPVATDDETKGLVQTVVEFEAVDQLFTFGVEAVE